MSKSCNIGVRRGGKYANGYVPANQSLEPKEKTAASTVLQPVVNAVTEHGATGNAVLAMRARNKANEEALNLANGTPFVEGPGTGTSDSIPVNVSRGEAILPAKTVQAIGVDKLAQIIRNTNGKEPTLGARPGGKHAAGMTPEEEQAASDRTALSENVIEPLRGVSKKIGAAAMDVATLPGRAIAGVANTAIRLPNAMGANIPFIPESVFGGDSSSMAPYMDKLRAAEQPAVQSAQPTMAAAPVAQPSFGARPSAAVAPAAPLAQPTSNNYIRNESTGKTTYLNPTDPQAASPQFTQSAPPDMSMAPSPTKLASTEKNPYEPKTLAGALVQHGETKRQSGLQQADNQNALAAYEAAGRDKERTAAATDRKNQMDTAGRKLGIDEARARREKFTPIMGKDEMGNTVYQGAFDTGTGQMLTQNNAPQKTPTKKLTDFEG